MAMIVNKKVARTLALKEARAAEELCTELYEWLSEEEPDLEMVLPICKEIQAKVQIVATRVEDAFL